VAYGRALEELGQAKTSAGQALALRRCEFELLDELGYAVDFRRTCTSGEAVQAGRRYRIVAGDGLVPEADANACDGTVFCGEDLLAVADGHLEKVNSRALRQMSRLLLAAHLGPQPLRSQDMFHALRSPRSSV
jgi:DNA repair protein RecO (recombination protein O)